MLEEVLSAGAAALYQRLLDTGGMSLDGDDNHGVYLDDDQMQELMRLGLATDVAGQRRLVPQAPMTAFQNLLAQQQQRIASEVHVLTEVHRELEQAQRSFTRSQTSNGQWTDLARVLTNPDEISAWADHLRYLPDWECLALQTAPAGAVSAKESRFLPDPAERVQHGVRYRTIYAREWLECSYWGRELPVLTEQSAEETRFRPDMRWQLRIADDHTALVALVPNGLEAALLVRAPLLVMALRQLFDDLWQRSQPLSGSTSVAEPELTLTQHQVLRLLAAGLKDEAIARTASVSVKTVRRHVANLLHRLGADTRFAAGVEAARRGWLD